MGSAQDPVTNSMAEKTIGVEDNRSTSSAMAGDVAHHEGVAAAHNEDAPVDFSEVQEMKQGLGGRHLQMMALAGAVGTGLFLGSGRAIANAGPLGALLGYTFVGIAAAGVVLEVSEMAALMPVAGGIVRYAEVWVDPALSFANGWNMVYKGIIFIPTEIVAGAVLMGFWLPTNSAVVSSQPLLTNSCGRCVFTNSAPQWITVFGFLMAISNSLFIRVLGELEFGFALLKISLIVIVNVMALVIVCGGAPNHEVIGFKYWNGRAPLYL